LEHSVVVSEKNAQKTVNKTQSVDQSIVISGTVETTAKKQHIHKITQMHMYTHHTFFSKR